MNQANIFETYMRGVWENVLTRDDEDVYDTDENACEIAQVFGARPTSVSADQGEDGSWTEWLFPDGSIAWILVRDDTGIGTHNVLP